MIVTGLKLANLRAIEVGEFAFKPGFNLIVGVNGVGKSTVLDALRISMSHLLPRATESRAKPISFALSDIRDTLPFLDVTMRVSLGGKDFQLTSRKWRKSLRMTRLMFKVCGVRFLTAPDCASVRENFFVNLTLRRALKIPRHCRLLIPLRDLHDARSRDQTASTSPRTVLSSRDPRRRETRPQGA